MKHDAYPAGWSVRMDRDAAPGEVLLMDHGQELHAATGPAGAVYYNAGWNGTGDFSYAVRFRQPKPSAHPEGYGVIFGGAGLDGAEQRYSYFLVRQTGEYFVATRRGAERTKVIDWTPHAAIQKVSETDPAVNVLGVAVVGDEVAFSVNGTEVARRPASELVTDGAQGFRVNHRLELFIDRITR
jgi:hypothetical protein